MMTLMAWREKIHEVIFEADTPSGKAFDAALLVAILASILAVMLESVRAINETYGGFLRVVEWVFTGLFTLEYLLRLVSVKRPWNYAKSAFGIVDLLAILPTYLSVFITGSQSFLVIRGLRLLRVFRIFKLGRFLGEADLLATALRASRFKIIVFLTTVLTVILIIGTLMYLIEGDEHGFTSIPRGVYWAIITMTTVGYGNVTPQTVAGQCLAAALMVIGYGVIAVPTGIVSVEIAHASQRRMNTRCCEGCAAEGHDTDALYCKFCGDRL